MNKAVKQESIDSRLLYDGEQEMLGALGKAPNAAEWAVYRRKQREQRAHEEREQAGEAQRV